MVFLVFFFIVVHWLLPLIIYQTLGLQADSGPTRPCHVALSLSFAVGTWRISILLPLALALRSCSSLSYVNTEAFCVYKGQLCSKHLPDVTDLRALHSGDRSPERERERESRSEFPAM